MAIISSNDPGLLYLQEIGFKRIKGKYGLPDRFIKLFGRSKATQLMRKWDNLATGSREFYDFKNADREISRAFSEAYDEDIIRKSCNYIAAHKAYFGDTILEVGCDCGIMSCFLAKTFPDATIVSVDRCGAAIEIAREFAQNRGLTNITFIACDLKDVTQTFDTVFSMRTMHENFDADEDCINDLGEQAAIFSNSLSAYASALDKVLSDEGMLISIERTGRNALMLGWMDALNNVGLKFDLLSYEELACIEAGEESIFQAFICLKGVESDIGAKEMFNYACSKYLDYSKAEYEGWDAKIVYENRRGKLIEGYNLVYLFPPIKVRVSLWTHNTDDTCLIQYQNNNGFVKASFVDISQKENVLNAMHDALDKSRAYGHVTITKIQG